MQDLGLLVLSSGNTQSVYSPSLIREGIAIGVSRSAQVLDLVVREAPSFCSQEASSTESPHSEVRLGAARLSVWKRRCEPRVSSSIFPLAQAKGIRAPMSCGWDSAAIGCPRARPQMLRPQAMGIA